MVQSRFLKEAQPVLYPNRVDERKKYEYSTYNSDRRISYDDDSGYTSSSGYSSSYAKTMLGGNRPKENKNVQYGKFKSGVKVKHVKFGDGVVITVKGSGDNIIVDVAFKGVGIKSLSAKYAPMEIVNE